MCRASACFFAFAIATGCTRADRNAPVDSSCVDEPPAPPPGERGPFPFENCQPRITDQRPVRELDQEATVRRRQTAAKACCYAPLGNR